MENPSISVIIPVFNSAKTIEKCLESVIDQSVKVFEIIVINDGSTDDTEQLIQNYRQEKGLQNLLIITQANSGPASARNRGINEAKGEWIAFLDADDRWFPDKIAKQLKLLAALPGISIIGTEFFPYVRRHKNSGLKKISFNRMLLRNMLFTSTVIVKKDIVERYFFDENKRYAEDFKLWLQIVQSNDGVVLQEGLVLYSDNQKKYKRNSLSNNLWDMEKNELEIYLFFYKKHSISVLFLIVLMSFSILKFFYRYLQSIL